MDTFLEFDNRPSSVEEPPETLDDSSGKLLEEAFDYFTCMEIGRSIEKKAAKSGKIDEETLSNEIIAQFAKTQAPKGKVKFGDTKVTHFREDEVSDPSKKLDLPVTKLSMPPPILKITQQDQLREQPAEADTQTSGHQVKLLEVFRRCYTLCNIPMGQFDENNPFKSLKNLCDGIRRAFKAKDECYKYVRHEQNRKHSQEIKNLQDLIQGPSNNNHDPLTSMQINRLQELIDEYKDEIRDLTAQVTSANYEMSGLRSNNASLQTTKNNMTERLESAFPQLDQLENYQRQNIELIRERTELSTRHQELEQQHKSLQEKYSKVLESNGELTSRVNSLTTAANRWSADHTELKLARDNFESLNRDLNDKLLKGTARIHELQTTTNQLQKNSHDSKLEFKSRIQQLIDENVRLTSHMKNSHDNLQHVQSKYEILNSDYKEILKQKDKFQRDSDRKFAKILELQLHSEQLARFKEQALKFSAEREACLITLKKLDFDHYHLKISFDHLSSLNRDLSDFQKAAKPLLQQMDSKIIQLQQQKNSDAFKIDTLTRQVLKQTHKIHRLHSHIKSFKNYTQNLPKKPDILRSLANTKTLLKDPLVLNKNFC